MRIERLSDEQFKIFLTFDDLVERGLHTNNMKVDTITVKNLFSDMMDEACVELGIDLEGSFHLQVEIMQSQGMNVYVTQEMDKFDYDYDEYVDMNVTLTESNELIFCFNEFENIIQVANYLKRLNINGGQVYFMNDCYYFLLVADELGTNMVENVIAVMSEFSRPSIITSYNLKEYGKPIFLFDSVQQIIHYFR